MKWSKGGALLATLKLTTSEVVNYLKSNGLDSSIRNLQASGNQIKFNIRIIKKILEPGFKVRFKEHRGNTVILGLSFDVLRGIDAALTKVLDKLINITGGIHLVKNAIFTGDEIHLTIDIIKIRSIQEQRDSLIIEFAA